MRNLILLVALSSAMGADATDVDAKLRIDADLVIHPEQIEQVLLRSIPREEWKLSEIKLEKPYKVTLASVQAVGPWEISTSINQNKIEFTFKWLNPMITIGELAIQDTVLRVVGGVPINVNLSGRCNSLTLEVPGGDWHISGRMRLDVAANHLDPVWNSFDFLGAQKKSGVIAVGSCTGPSLLLTSVREMLDRAASDHKWFESLIKQALLDLAKSELHKMSQRLLAKYDFSVFGPLIGSWIPSRLSNIGEGRLRVEGEFVLSIPGSDIGADHVVKEYDPRVLLESSESGFTFPKNTFGQVLRFLYANGLLQYRLSSYEIPAFQSLMWNRLAQFFVWPDLMSFNRQSQFYFYLSAQSAPQVNGFEIWFPLAVQQWAPVANGSFVPYINLQTYIHGQIAARVANNKLSISLQPNDLNLSYGFASEFQRYRRVSSRLSIGLIGSNVRDYLSQKYFELSLPTIPITPSQSAYIREIQMQPEYLRLPLAIP